jgi:hypothetical protein
MHTPDHLPLVVFAGRHLHKKLLYAEDQAQAHHRVDDILPSGEAFKLNFQGSRTFHIPARHLEI